MKLLLYFAFIVLIISCSAQTENKTRIKILADSMLVYAAKDMTQKEIADKYISFIDESLELDSNQKVLVLSKINLLSNSKQYSRVIEEIEKQQKKGGSNRSAAYILGMYYELVANYEKADSCYNATKSFLLENGDNSCNSKLISKHVNALLRIKDTTTLPEICSNKKVYPGTFNLNRDEIIETYTGYRKK